MCAEWEHSFETFRDWALSHGYTDNLTIERIDVNGNYCPENCKWIPFSLQCRNTSKTIFLEFQGEKRTLIEWAEITGITVSALRQRIKHGWSVERALTTPMLQ